MSNKADYQFDCCSFILADWFLMILVGSWILFSVGDGRVVEILGIKVVGSWLAIPGAILSGILALPIVGWLFERKDG